MIDKLPSGLMEVTISAYKPSGKWCSSHTLRCRNIDVSSREFVCWLRRNVPARLGPGATYVVQSTEADASSGNFHNQLFRHEQLWTEAEDLELRQNSMYRRCEPSSYEDAVTRLSKLLREDNKLIVPYVIKLDFID